MQTITLGHKTGLEVGDRLSMRIAYFPSRNWFLRLLEWLHGRDLEDPVRRFTIVAAMQGRAGSTMTIQRAE